MKIRSLKYYIIHFLIIILIFPGCLKDENIKLEYAGYVPDQLNDDWEISTPGAEGFNEGEIENVYRQFYSEENYPTIHSLLIVRNNKLVAEAYFRDNADQSRFHAIQSSTKAITSTLFGIAMDKGMIDSVNTPVSFY